VQTSLKANQQIDAVPIDLLFKNVDLVIICNDLAAQIAITIEQSLNRSLKDPICKTRHHQNVVL
jgi:hypothetical protein